MFLCIGTHSFSSLINHLCLLFPGYTTEIDRDCWWNDIVKLHDETQCQIQCWRNDRCVGYIRSNDRSECWLKSACATGWAPWRVAHIKGKQFLIACGET